MVRLWQHFNVEALAEHRWVGEGQAPNMGHLKMLAYLERVTPMRAVQRHTAASVPLELELDEPSS